jgi:hypothetical protein
MSKGEVAVRTDRLPFVRRGLLGLFLGAFLAACGCGGASSTADSASSEEGQRFKAMQKLGTNQTKADLAEKRKQALAELASKKGAAPAR